MRRKVDAKAMYRERYLGLLEEHTPALHRLCHSYCEARAEAEDLFQEIALAIWTALARFRGESSDRTWLYRIAHNVALTFATKRRKQVEREQPVENEMDLPSPGGELESRLDEVQKQETPTCSSGSSLSGTGGWYCYTSRASRQPRSRWLRV